MSPDSNPGSDSGHDPDSDPGSSTGHDPETPPVRAVYDRIAEHFARTRANPWPEVESFLADVPGGRVGLDLGCGNGRHARLLGRRVERVVGLDVSRALLAIAAGEYPPAEYVQGDAARLPLADGSIDVAVYVATLHHLRSREARVHSLDELARVLAPDGRALVSVWSTEHDRFDADSVPASEASGGSSDERSESDGGFDAAVDWTLPDGETVPRFYHVYDPTEFRADLDRSDLRVREAFVSSGNCYAEVEGKRP